MSDEKSETKRPPRDATATAEIERQARVWRDWDSLWEEPRPPALTQEAKPHA